jgi:hypothetical protein
VKAQGKENKMNVTITDNGAAYMIAVNGLIVDHKSSLGAAWEHLIWMHRIAQQTFTVGKKQIPITQWIEGMKMAGYLD